MVKQAFLKKGAELIKTMEEGKRKIAVLEKKSDALSALLRPMVSRRLNKYYDIKVEIVKKQEGVAEAGEKI